MLSQENNSLLTESGPGTPFGELLRRFWVPALLASEIPDPDGPPVRTTIMGEELLAFRDTRGRVGLVDAYCAHRGAPLFFGRNEERGLRCVYHGWKYDLDGNCVDTPNEPPTGKFKQHIRLTAYPTQEAGGVVWAYMGTRDATPAMPHLEWLKVPGSHVHIDKHIVESNFLQALEGDHGSSHASALHSTLGGTTSDEWLASRTQFSNVYMLDKAPKLFVLETPYGILTGSRRNAASGLYLWRIVPWLKPFFSLIAHEPGQSMILNARVPMDDENSWFHPAGGLLPRAPRQPIATDHRRPDLGGGPPRRHREHAARHRSRRLLGEGRPRRHPQGTGLGVETRPQHARGQARHRRRSRRREAELLVDQRHTHGGRERGG